MSLKQALSEDYINWSNFLSVFRVLLIPPFILLIQAFHEDSTRTDILFYLLFLSLLAIASDFLDGFLARLLKQETMIGQYLDPVCDKIVTVTALGLITMYFGFPLWIFIIYTLREVLGVWGGTFLFFKRGIQGKPNMWGKSGVFVVSISAIWYILTPYFEHQGLTGILLMPEISAYLLLGILIGGIIAYGKTYLPIIAAEHEKKKTDR